jgi:hypothetical protein
MSIQLSDFWIFPALFLTALLCAGFFYIQNWWREYKEKKERLRTDPPSKYETALKQMKGR